MAKMIRPVDFEEANLLFHACQPTAPERDIRDVIQRVAALTLVVERWTVLANEFKHTTPEHERELAVISQARGAISNGRPLTHLLPTSVA
ncbi:hypothetical protein J1G33_23885 [Pseudomonas sp. P867]|uniref:hypothetical protein n=1 Tax=Pseudomonas sp. P867 TaxID=2816050 RepID=UPI001CA6A10D|nr:hypothetical protein [Pseudomonas sp. P867]MBY8973431.1 hypothetical protein [Pseudomonas sp. P867]